MKFDLPKDLERFDFYVQKYREKSGLVELKRPTRPRTIKQNKYLHVLITLFGIELGYNVEESKTILKRNCPFMIYEKKGHKFVRSTTDLSTKEMKDFIDWIRNYASIEHSIYLPTAEEHFRDWVEIEKTIEANKSFL